MRKITIRNISLGEGMPKICVPIVSKTKADILSDAKEIVKTPAQIVEWRVDWFDGIQKDSEVLETLAELRSILGEMPLLFTLRSKNEGGEGELSLESYRELNHLAIESGYVDMLDVEMLLDYKVVQALMEAAHNKKICVIISNHSFKRTPSHDEIINILKKMQDMGGDILKVAVMPTCEGDVLTLISATNEFHKNYAKQPIITMSMSGKGLITRIIGEVFGSCMTFGSLGKASAPGQIDVFKLKQMLDIFSEGIQ